MISAAASPLLSVVIVNYNGADWMTRCLESLSKQTIAHQIEVIVVDNASPDASADIAENWISKGGPGTLIRSPKNLGFSEANNVGARVARGKYLFFLNNDAWAEVDCLEKLLHEVEREKADSAAVTILNYHDNTFQGIGAAGLDLFGIPNAMSPVSTTTEIFAAGGCSALVGKEMFDKIGGFPAELFMYGEEADLGWRVWLAGGRIIVVPDARIHHREKTAPTNAQKNAEPRTSDMKRYLSNRNGILLLLKNSQHILLLLLIPHLLLLFAEAAFSLLIVRRWSYVRKCYLEALVGCWQLRNHVKSSRARIRAFRRRSDFWMLRFLTWRLNRWPDIVNLFRFGFPKVDER